MADDVDKYLWRYVGRVQKSKTVRNLVAVAVLLGLVGLGAKFVNDLLPRHYQLTITGGDLLGNRHYLAKLVQEQARSYGVAMKIVPTGGSEQALELVNDGKLDLAFIQGGLDARYPNVQHVATLPPELIHFLVKPAIKDIKDIKGKLINLGSRDGGTRIVSKEILKYSGLRDQVDYVETNFSDEELIAMQRERLPDAVVLVSYAPSDVADFLVQQRGFHLLEMPFPPSLAARLGWVADTKLLGYMYSINPPVPPKDIEVVGVNLHLVANQHVEPRAIERVLEALYSAKVASRFKQKINEADIMVPSGFPVSAGTELFMARNDPLLPTALFDKIKAAFGLLMSLASTVLIAYRWYRADEPAPPKKDDAILVDYLGQIADIDRRAVERLGGDEALPEETIDALSSQLATLKNKIVAVAQSNNLDNPGLVQTAFLCIADTRAALSQAAVAADHQPVERSLADATVPASIG